MANTFYQPRGNAFKFTVMNYAQIPQYVSRFIDDFLFWETRKKWKQGYCYCNKWLTVDAFRGQYVSDYEPTTIGVYKAKDNTLQLEQPFELIAQDVDRPGFWIKQFDVDAVTFPPEFYYLVIKCANVLTLVSEPFEIVESLEPNTSFYLEWDHPTPKDELIYYNNAGAKIFNPTLRVPGGFEYERTEYKETLFVDIKNNTKVVKNIAYDVHTFTLGGAAGVPPYMPQIVARILGNENVKFDGRLWVRATENSRFEKVDEEEYAKAGYTIELIEKLNRAAQGYTTDVPIIGLNSMMAVVERKGFGMDDSGGNFLEINQTV